MRDLDLKVISKYNTGKNAANPKLEIPLKDEKHPETGQTYKVIDSDKFAEDVKNHKSLTSDQKIAIDNAITDYVCIMTKLGIWGTNTLLTIRSQTIQRKKNCRRRRVQVV